jgi:hypothetical protein
MMHFLLKNHKESRKFFSNHPWPLSYPQTMKIINPLPPFIPPYHKRGRGELKRGARGDFKLIFYLVIVVENALFFLGELITIGFWRRKRIC